MVRDIRDAALGGRLNRKVLVLDDAIDLPQDGVERILQRAIELVALRGLQLVQVAHDARARVITGQAMSAFQEPRDIFTRENGLGDGDGCHGLAI